MSDVATDPSVSVADAEGEVHHEHASDLIYIKLAVLLAVLTGAEVAWPYIIEDGPALMWPLLIMMVVKFALIAAYFMHLKFDSKILTRIFYTGLLLAVSVYVVVLITMHVFDG